MKILFLLMGFIGMTLQPTSAEEAPAEARTASDQLLAALTQGDYPAFISGGDTAFQGLKKEQFDAVSAQLGPLLRAGYTATYLGELRQKGFQVTLWRLRFRNGGDDALATLSLKDGKIGGFWIK